MSKKSSPISVILSALRFSERFISGFEDDETQKVKPQLTEIRKAIKIAESDGDKVVIFVEGGMVQAVYTDLVQLKVIVLDKDQEDVGEPIRASIADPEPLELAPAEIARHL